MFVTGVIFPEYLNRNSLGLLIRFHTKNSCSKTLHYIHHLSKRLVIVLLLAKKQLNADQCQMHFSVRHFLIPWHSKGKYEVNTQNEHAFKPSLFCWKKRKNKKQSNKKENVEEKLYYSILIYIKIVHATCAINIWDYSMTTGFGFFCVCSVNFRNSIMPQY